jgi:hypothetical protein
MSNSGLWSLVRVICADGPSTRPVGWIKTGNAWHAVKMMVRGDDLLEAVPLHHGDMQSVTSLQRGMARQQFQG